VYQQHHQAPRIEAGEVFESVYFFRCVHSLCTIK
jgi:hypothetical protein